MCSLLSAIAQQLGIMEPGDRAVTGSELAKLSEEELDQQIEDIAVYARVSPEDKIRIVKGLATQRRDRSHDGVTVSMMPPL